MDYAIIKRPETLPDLLDQDGRLRLLPSAAYDDIAPDTLRYWCNRNSRYGLPTSELIGWLRDLIGNRKAIEIGSGNGDLSYHLGIPGTDNKMQARLDIAAYYMAMGQPVVDYPDWVQEMDALEAVRLHKPEVTIASWVTHWIDPELPPPVGGGNMFGVKEDVIIETGTTYVMLGNLAVHRHKPILALPHEEHALPFLRSRSLKPELDRVFIWRPQA